MVSSLKIPSLMLPYYACCNHFPPIWLHFFWIFSIRFSFRQWGEKFSFSFQEAKFNHPESVLDLHRSSISLMAICHTMVISKTNVLFLWCTIHVNSRSCATFYQPEEIPVNLNSLLFSKTFLHFSETFLRVNRGQNDAVLKKNLRQSWSQASPL